MIKTTKTTNKQIKDLVEISAEQINQDRMTVNIWQQLIRKLPHHIIVFVNFTCVRYNSINILLKSPLAGVVLNFLKFTKNYTKTFTFFTSIISLPGKTKHLKTSGTQIFVNEQGTLGPGVESQN